MGIFDRIDKPDDRIDWSEISARRSAHGRQELIKLSQMEQRQELMPDLRDQHVDGNQIVARRGQKAAGWLARVIDTTQIPISSEFRAGA